MLPEDILTMERVWVELMLLEDITWRRFQYWRRFAVQPTMISDAMCFVTALYNYLVARHRSSIPVNERLSWDNVKLFDLTGRLIIVARARTLTILLKLAKFSVKLPWERLISVTFEQ